MAKAGSVLEGSFRPAWLGSSLLAVTVIIHAIRTTEPVSPTSCRTLFALQEKDLRLD